MLSIISAKNRTFAHIQPITFPFLIPSSACFLYSVPHGPAHVRDDCYPCQRCRSTECVEDARPFFNSHDTALCPCAGQQYHEGHAGCCPGLRIIRKGYTSQRTVKYSLLHNEELFACMDWPRFYWDYLFFPFSISLITSCLR